MPTQVTVPYPFSALNVLTERWAQAVADYACKASKGLHTKNNLSCLMGMYSILRAVNNKIPESFSDAILYPVGDTHTGTYTDAEIQCLLSNLAEKLDETTGKNVTPNFLLINANDGLLWSANQAILTALHS